MRAFENTDVSSKRRTSKNAKWNDQSIRENARTAHTSGVKHLGFLGVSVFHYLHYFSLTNHIAIDYMHGTLLGITSKLLELWFDQKHVGSEHFIGYSLSSIDNTLISIQPPYMIHRLPRALTKNVSYWTAWELKETGCYSTLYHVWKLRSLSEALLLFVWSTLDHFIWRYKQQRLDEGKLILNMGQILSP